MRRYKTIFLTLIATVLLVACDKESMNSMVQSAPEIEAFYPESGSVGTEIVITGNYLDDVVSATIGGVQAELVEKVSNKQLTIRVPSGAQTGVITLANSLGETESESVFTMEYPAPTILTSSIPDELEMGNKLLISGENMNVISAVIFTADGVSEGHEAEIISQNTNEIVVKIPYVEKDDAVITFRYFDGSKDVETSKTTAPEVVIKRYQPVVSTTEFPVVNVGDVFILNGVYLNKIDKVTINGTECQITSQNETELKFLVPTLADFVDGNNTTTLSIVYFDGVESQVVSDEFVIKVPFVLFWKDRTVYGQGRDVPEMASFFSPETGVAYHNSLWRETIDPISYQYQASTCSANQKPAVTAAEYNSVKPYFFFSGVSAGNLQINSPAGSTGQLKNFYYFNNSSNEYRVTGANGNCYGTPVLTFLYLNPATPEHKAVIDMAANGTLEKIDEETFPINVDEKTCRGINIGSVANSLTQAVYAPGVFTIGQAKDTDVDSYIMVFYYNHNGLDSNNKAANIRRIGLLHIKHINFVLYNNTNAPSSSAITFDMYWMKHDYQHVMN